MLLFTNNSKFQDTCLALKRLITKKMGFSASHRYWNPDWSEEENRSVFGKLSGEYGHGHNFELEVTFEGDIDAQTGMIINLFDIKSILIDVLKDFDHKYLNEDNENFKDIIPTPENMSKVLWDLVGKRIENYENCKLYNVRLYETKDFYVDYRR